MVASVWRFSGVTVETLGLLALAGVLSSVIGLERQIRQKAAGLRTHALVGLGSALFTIVSGYGFSTVLGHDVVLDPSRVAAQIASGIGFIGAGVIFTQGAAVRGITTAGGIWMTAAIGMAAGAGLPWMALFGTGFYLLVTIVVTRLMSKIPGAAARRILEIRYQDGHGVLRNVLAESTTLGFATEVLSTSKVSDTDVAVRARFRGRQPLPALIATLSELDGVLDVHPVPEATDDEDD